MKGPIPCQALLMVLFKMNKKRHKKRLPAKSVFVKRDLWNHLQTARFMGQTALFQCHYAE